MRLFFERSHVGDYIVDRCSSNTRDGLHFPLASSDDRFKVSISKPLNRSRFKILDIDFHHLRDSRIRRPISAVTGFARLIENLFASRSICGRQGAAAESGKRGGSQNYSQF
jgi:hypothetical protein